MRDYSPRSSYESDNVPWSKAVARRATRTTIGQELKALYQVPQDVPQGMLTLLMPCLRGTNKNNRVTLVGGLTGF
jgi:hypothetical protein